MSHPIRAWRRFAYSSLLAVTVLPLLSAGCGPSSSNDPAGKKSGAGGGSNSTDQPDAGPGKDQKTCFQCGGKGVVACSAPGCEGGKVECQGPCLRLTRGSWIHMEVEGHDPSELWQKFPHESGEGGYAAWNQHHVGEVIVYENGKAVNTGPCKVCGGTTRVTCSNCKGQGTQICMVCAGKGFVPLAQAPASDTSPSRQLDTIRLKDGRVLVGKVVMSIGRDLTIKTPDGKTLHVDASEVLPKSETNSTK